jgi:hypothetical protein
MPVPSDCAPEGPRIEGDLSDFVDAWDPDVHFTAADMKSPGGYHADLSDPAVLAEHLAHDALLRQERLKKFGGTQPLLSGMLNKFRPAPATFLSIERHTNVPVWSWFRKVEDGLDDSELATSDTIKELRLLAQRLRGPRGFFKSNRETRKQVQRLFETKMHDPAAAKTLAEQMDPSVATAADELMGIYQRYFIQQDLTPDDINDFWKAIGALRQLDGDYLALKTSGAKIPKILTSLEQEFRTGEIMLDAREWDFYAIGERMIRAHAKQRHLAPAWNNVKVEFDALEAEGVVSSEALEIFSHYMNQVRYVPDGWQISMGRAMSQISERITGRKLPPSEIFNPVQAFLSTNYYVNMAFNTGVALRNFMQPWITTYPILGEKYSFSGYRTAVNAMFDEATTLKYARLGVITRDVEPMAANAIRENMAAQTTRIRGGGAAWDIHNAVKDFGWRGFRAAENTNRIMSYQGMVDRSTDWGKRFLKNEINWNQFWEGSRLDSMDTLNGPLTAQMRALMEAGNLEKTAHLMGLQFTRKTQFMYRRGNTPYVMQGTVGRLFGQYGTWPSWYTSYMGDMAFQGTVSNRIKTSSRWIAANAAIMGGASEVFGVDMAHWAFFSPMGYTGGPVTQIATQAIAAASSPGTITPESWGLPKSTDPVKQMQATRLLQAWQQITPGVPWAGARNVRDAVERFQEEDYATAAKRFMGFQPVEE